MTTETPDNTTVPRTSKIPAKALAVLLAAVFLAGLWMNYRGILARGEQYDDSFITYRYAVNLAEGHGLTYSRFERVNSASSLLYTALLASSYRLGLHAMEQTGAALNILAGVVGLVLAFQLAVTVSRSRGVAFLCLLPVALSGAWTGWAASGMETILYASLTMSCVWAYAKGRLRLAAALLGACLLCRSEAVLVWLAILAAEILAGIQPRRFALFLVTGLGALAAIYGFYFLYYGAWMPHAVNMKGVSAYYSPGLPAQARNLMGFFLGGFASLTILGSIGILAYARSKWRSRGQPLPDPAARLNGFVAFFLSLTAASLLLGPRSDLVRYGVHTLPFWSIAVAGLWPRIRDGAAPAIRAIAVLAFALVSVSQSVGNAIRTKEDFHTWSAHQGARKAMGRWLETHVSNPALVLSSDVGAIGYEARRHEFYDLLGLLSRAPFVAAREDRWVDVYRDLERRAPRYLCDTVMPTGEARAIQILQQPTLYYRTVTRNPTERLKYVATVVESTWAGGYGFVIAKIQWQGRN